MLFETGQHARAIGRTLGTEFQLSVEASARADRDGEVIEPGGLGGTVFGTSIGLPVALWLPFSAG